MTFIKFIHLLMDLTNIYEMPSLKESELGLEVT